MSRLRTACILGLATGAIGVVLSLVPAISSLEDTLGLRSLFAARGPLPPPAGVVVVSIDEPAAERLNLPPLVRDWPRAYHARLIDRLVEQGASVIVFDLQFLRETSAADDAALAGAITRSQRVVLVQYFERGAVAGQQLWHWLDPIPAFAKGAVGLAPVPIPDTPLVSWFWSFLKAGSQEVPTLPAVALQAGAMRVAATLSNSLKSAGVDVPDSQINTSGELLVYMQELRRLLKGNTSALSRAVDQLATTSQLASEEKQLARAVAGLYADDAAAYLNFYGPPGTVCTVPYDVVHDGAASPCPIKGATVFVGVGRSRLDRAQQIDTYHTIYERSDGVDFSGVELHATAFANLLTGTALRPLSPFAILLGLGLLLGGSAYWTRTRRRHRRGNVAARLEAAGVVVLLVVGYSAAAYVLFARSYLIVPLVIPVAVQLPAALILGLLARPIVREERVQAVCLAADASGSTAIGQRLSHDAYAALMMDYSRTLARCVTTRGGLALPPHGDGFVSLWVLRSRADDGGDVSIRSAACQAALEMATAADRFNRARAESERLPLRLGLTLGAVTIRSDADRGAFEAVGDAVNVAARLQQVNRELGTCVLASAQLVADLSGEIELQRIDVPLTLKGVRNAPDVFEITGPVHSPE